MKIHSKRELQQIANNNSADMNVMLYFMNIYRKCTSELYIYIYIFTIDNTIPANNHLRFRKNLLGSL